MAVESPNKSAISPLRFFNRTARVNQEGISVFKEKLVQIDSSFKKILSVKDRTIDTSKMEEEESQRQEKEKKLEDGKFFVRGVGKLANAIPGKNTIQKFLVDVLNYHIFSFLLKCSTNIRTKFYTIVLIINISSKNLSFFPVGT